MEFWKRPSVQVPAASEYVKVNTTTKNHVPSPDKSRIVSSTSQDKKWEKMRRSRVGIPELQLAVDPLGWQFEKKFV